MDNVWMDESLLADLSVYKMYVDHSFKVADGRLIGNSSQEHAAILVDGMFRNAENEVHVLAKECSNGSYGLTSTLKSADEFVKKGGVLSILIEDLPDTELSKDRVNFLEAMIDHSKSNSWRPGVKVRKVLAGETGKYNFNFIVADSKHYRLEDDRKHSTAIAGFGRSFMACDLVSRHERLWNNEKFSQNLSVEMFSDWSNHTV